MSVAIIADRIIVAQDAPWALDLNIYSDLLATAPVALQAGAAWLRSPGGASLIATQAGGKVFIAENTVAIRLAQSDLTQLAAGPVYIEAQWQDTAGNVGRADFSGVRLLAGSAAGFTAPQALGVAYNITFAAEESDSAVLGLVGGPMGPPRTSAELQVSDALQQLLGVTNADDALAALAEPLATADAQEIGALLGGAPPTLTNILTLLCRRSGALSPGGGDWNPNL